MSPAGLPKYAKLSRPRVHDALPRERLFARLDALRAAHAVVWLASPPGAGKTTLAASYLSAIQADSVWCQIDEGDSDPATLFFFLTEAVRNTKPALPWLAPELAGDIPRFARLFFREFYARLPHGTIVVLDNIQEFDWSNSGELIEIAFSEIPDGINILALSRDPPPARLARLELSGRLATIGWDELRLDMTEAQALMQLDDAAASVSRTWLERIDGWAAGVIMLREHLAEYPDASSVPPLEGRDAVFRYFAGEILERMPKTWQHMLLLLSCLPGVSAADARQLTGDPAAARLLSQLFHHRLFVDRRGPAPFTYHFHALFREFLQYEAEQRLDAHERAALLERAATILDDQGRTDDAARLYHDARAYPQLIRMLLRRAAGMLATGRGQTWREWLGWVPEAMIAAEPWLWYWQGTSLNHVEPALGRQVLARAEQAFRASGDVRARLLAIAAIIDSYVYEWAGFQALSQWVEAMLDALGALDPDTLDPEADLKIHSRLTLALCLTAGDSPVLARCAQRCLRALPVVESPAERLAAGTFLLDYLTTIDPPAARQLIASLNRLAEDATIGPFHRIWWYRPASFRYQLDANPAAQQMIVNAKRLAIEFGLDHLLVHFNLRLSINILGSGELAQAAALIEEMRRCVRPSRKVDLVYIKILEACYLAQSGDLHAATLAADAAVTLGDKAVISPTTRCQVYASAACCHAQAGNFERAEQLTQVNIERAYGFEREYAVHASRFVRTYALLTKEDHGRATEALAEMFHALQHSDVTLSVLFSCYPHLARQLFAFALREGIAVSHVRDLIARQGLAAPDRITPNWPWPAAVRSFGKIELSLHGEIINPSGKAQQRPLMLLKALLATGDGSRAQQALAPELWPDAADSKAALNVTVHRLRKLLGNSDALIVAAGKVALADTLVWSDVAALAELCDRIDAMAGDAPADDVTRIASHLLDLYRGPFCDGDDDYWLLPARERWRNRFLGAIDTLGPRLEALRDWPAAQKLYLRALEAEPLAETLYRGLIRCAHAQSDPSAAFSAYRRCRDTLSILVGRQPSAETEKLLVSLGLKAV